MSKGELFPKPLSRAQKRAIMSDYEPYFDGWAFDYQKSRFLRESDLIRQVVTLVPGSSPWYRTLCTFYVIGHEARIATDHLPNPFESIRFSRHPEVADRAYQMMNETFEPDIAKPLSIDNARSYLERLASGGELQTGIKVRTGLAMLMMFNGDLNEAFHQLQLAAKRFEHIRLQKHMVYERKNGELLSTMLNAYASDSINSFLTEIKRNRVFSKESC